MDHNWVRSVGIYALVMGMAFATFGIIESCSKTGHTPSICVPVSLAFLATGLLAQSVASGLKHQAEKIEALQKRLDEYERVHH